MAQIKDPMIDQKLYVGGIGMEYVLPNGAIASEGGKFVKIIDHKGSSIGFKSETVRKCWNFLRLGWACELEIELWCSSW